MRALEVQFVCGTAHRGARTAAAARAPRESSSHGERDTRLHPLQLHPMRDGYAPPLSVKKCETERKNTISPPRPRPWVFATGFKCFGYTRRARRSPYGRRPAASAWHNDAPEP